jgi:thioredoxin reductase
VVGGGDSAVEAAMGLASQTGNQVTVSYRSERFSRIKERNQKRIEEFVSSEKLRVLFNSSPVEFKPESVMLDVKGNLQEIQNDFVWIFAGGTPPNDFLKRIGVGFGTRDLTLEASKEAKRVEIERKQMAQAVAAPAR